MMDDRYLITSFIKSKTKNHCVYSSSNNTQNRTFRRNARCSANSSLRYITSCRWNINSDIGVNTSTTHLNIDVRTKASIVDVVYPSILIVGSCNLFEVHDISAAIRQTELPLTFAWIVMFLYFYILYFRILHAACRYQRHNCKIFGRYFELYSFLVNIPNQHSLLKDRSLFITMKFYSSIRIKRN